MYSRMSKGLMFVTVCVVGVVVLFSVTSYLMATLEPPKLAYDSDIIIDDNNIESYDQSPDNYPPKPSKPDDTPPGDDRRYANIFFNDGFAPFIDTAQYGLEKGVADEIDFYHSTNRPSLSFNDNYTGGFTFPQRKVVPPLWPRATRTMIINPTMQVVVPPMWPPTKTSSPSTEPSAATADNVITDTYNNNDIKNGQNATNKTSVKPMKRRSVSNYKIDDNSGSLILKILDSLGHARIEIKLSTDDKNNSKKKTKLFGKSKSKFTMKPNHNDLRESAELLKDTIVRIMPDDTVMDESDGKLISDNDISDITNITDLLTSVLLGSTRNKYKENNNTEFEVLDKKREYENKNTLADQLYEAIISGMAKFENNTNAEVENKTDIVIDNHNESKVVESKLNSTEFDIMANTKMNYTVFNKFLFESDENTVNTTNLVHSQEPDNFTIGTTYSSDTNHSVSFVSNNNVTEIIN